MPHQEAVRVMVRVRPFNARERQQLSEEEWPMSIIYMHPDSPKVDVLDKDGGIIDSYDFGETFWSIPESQKQICSKPFADQETVYKQMALPAVDAALEGYHACIFAYGQTGSGKTYSMLGSVKDPGIAPRLVDHLYERLEKANKKGWAFEVTLSFMEIYNEKVKDLLLEMGPPSPRHGRRRSSAGHNSPLGRKSTKHGDFRDLKVRQSQVIGVHVDGLTRLGPEQGVKTADAVKKVMRFGMEHRATAETKMNATSSRSHAIFQLCITAKNVQRSVTRYSHINIVDLAGSERITASGASGQTLVEATRINLSLTTLRRVIDALIHNSKHKSQIIPPYRDSLLTYILSESLGGNSNTMMLAAISPSELNREDTINTLRYAMKAKSIVNTLKRNEEKTAGRVGHFAAEIAALRAQLSENDPDTEMYMEMKETLVQREHEQAAATLQAQDAKELMEKRRKSIVQAEIQRAEMVKQLEALEGVEDEHKLVASERRRAEVERDRIRTAMRKVESQKREAEQLLEEQQQAKEDLEQQKVMSIEQAALIRTDMDLLKRRKFAVAFKQAFGMHRAQGTGNILQHELRSIHDSIDRTQKDLAETELALVSALKKKRTTEIDLKVCNAQADDVQRSTAVQEKQVAADAMRRSNEDLISEVNILEEKVSELRLRVSSMDKSRQSAADRAEARGIELRRKMGNERARRKHLDNTLELITIELEDYKSELRLSRETKAKAHTDRKEKNVRTEGLLGVNRSLRESNEAMHMHLDVNYSELQGELKRLRLLHDESLPLGEEMRFASMLLHLGYGRAAATGQ
eukprot:gene16423-25175_t